jgi:hypothetical protein
MTKASTPNGVAIQGIGWKHANRRAMWAHMPPFWDFTTGLLPVEAAV